MIKVLFVCTGNICRSPTAEGVFRALVEEQGLAPRFVIESAGTDGYHEGEAPDQRAVKAALKHGISLQDKRARCLKAEDFEAFDYIFTMDSGHYYEVTERKPETCRAKVDMFGPSDVPDPWYGNEKDFDKAFDLIKDSAIFLLKKLRVERGL